MGSGEIQGLRLFALEKKLFALIWAIPGLRGSKVRVSLEFVEGRGQVEKKVGDGAPPLTRA